MSSAGFVVLSKKLGFLAMASKIDYRVMVNIMFCLGSLKTQTHALTLQLEEYDKNVLYFDKSG